MNLTPIGHTLTGLAIGYLAIPRNTPGKQKAGLLAAFAVVASAPDLPFPYWGHFQYDISHSLLMTTIGVICLEVALVWRFRGQPPASWRVMIGFALAWYSHLLLDSFYNRTVGLPVGWPFAMGRIALPIPWLSTADKSNIFSLHNVRVAVYEILTFGPLLAIAIASKYIVRRAPS